MASTKPKNEEIKEALDGVSNEVVNKASEEVLKKKDDGRVDYVLPLNVLGDEEVVEACLNGKVYQIQCGENVRIPKGLAEVLDNAIAQTKRVKALIKASSSKNKEITQ